MEKIVLIKYRTLVERNEEKKLYIFNGISIGSILGIKIVMHIPNPRYGGYSIIS